jgi:hypothetical protein
MCYMFRSLRVIISISEYACKCFEICEKPQSFILIVSHCLSVLIFFLIKNYIARAVVTVVT